MPSWAWAARSVALGTRSPFRKGLSFLETWPTSHPLPQALGKMSSAPPGPSVVSRDGGRVPQGPPKSPWAGEPPRSLLGTRDASLPEGPVGTRVCVGRELSTKGAQGDTGGPPDRTSTSHMGASQTLQAACGHLLP